MVSNYQGMLYLRMSVTVLDLQHRFFLHGRVQGYYSCVTWPRFHPHRTPSIWTMMTNRPNFHQLNYRQWYKLSFFYIKKNPPRIKRSRTWYQPGQIISKHCCISYGLPAQSFPPCDGAGFEHIRARVFIPFPQVLEHGDQRIQSDQWPSTKNFKKYLYNFHSTYIIWVPQHQNLTV